MCGHFPWVVSNIIKITLMHFNCCDFQSLIIDAIFQAAASDQLLQIIRRIYKNSYDCSKYRGLSCYEGVAIEEAVTENERQI